MKDKKEKNMETKANMPLYVHQLYEFEYKN